LKSSEGGTGGCECWAQPPGELAAAVGVLFHFALRTAGSVEADLTGEVIGPGLKLCLSAEGPGRAVVFIAAMRIASWLTTVDSVLLKPLPGAGDDAGMGRGG